MQQIPQEAVGEFINSLEQAIQTRVVDPAGFAQAFVERVGADMTRALLGTYSPSDIVEAIRQSPGGESSGIVTRDGQKYMAELWHRASLLVGAPAPAPVPSQPAEVVEIDAEAVEEPEDEDSEESVEETDESGE
jgi:hypothetical protein